MYYVKAIKGERIELTNCIQAAFSSGNGGATVSNQTMAITSNETTESATVTDTGLVLTMPTSDQMFFFGGQGSLLNDSGNTIYIQIQDASTDQPRQSAGVGTSDRVWFCLNYAGDCDGQEIRVRWSTDGGDSEATLYGTAGTSSGDAQASCQSLEVG